METNENKKCCPFDWSVIVVLILAAITLAVAVWLVVQRFLYHHDLL